MKNIKLSEILNYMGFELIPINDKLKLYDTMREEVRTIFYKDNDLAFNVIENTNAILNDLFIEDLVERTNLDIPCNGNFYYAYKKIRNNPLISEEEKRILYFLANPKLIDITEYVG